jgi:hypothetical protein
VAKLVIDQATVSTAPPDLLVITLVQRWDDGADFGGRFVLEATSAPALAELRANAGPRAEVALPHHLFVKLGGDDWEPCTIVQNRRDPSAVEGRTYCLQLGEATAREIVKQLVALDEAPAEPSGSAQQRRRPAPPRTAMY